MPATVLPYRYAQRLALPALLWVGCVLAMPAAAQGAATSPEATAKDPTIIITRTVNPRTAYRGVPRDDNPIRAEATTFPGQVFQGTLGLVMGSVVGDGDLGQRGSAGINMGDILPALDRAMTPMTGQGLFGSTASSGSPLGMSASAGGAVGGATRNLAPLITGNILQAVAPAAAQGGGR